MAIETGQTSSLNIYRLGLCILLFVLLGSLPAAFSKVAEEKLDQTDNFLAISDLVDCLVREKFVFKSLIEERWLPFAKTMKLEAQRACGMRDISKIINHSLERLKTSHCRFLTEDDEAFYFLRSLFQLVDKDSQTYFCGFATGGYGRPYGTVSYVLNGGPAERAGLSAGDQILSVDGQTSWTYKNLVNRTGHAILVRIKRNSLEKTLPILPLKTDLYELYLQALENSFRIHERLAGGRIVKIGYVHIFAGGSASKERLEDLLMNNELDALVLDLRQGYGGANTTDLDCVFRNKEYHPDLEYRGRDGQAKKRSFCFNKPIVTLIDSETTSGKELLAHVLKNSKRSFLVGEKTAGAAVAGRLFDSANLKAIGSEVDISSELRAILQKTEKHYALRGKLEPFALYLAVSTCMIGGVSLEGVGVKPDLEIRNPMKSNEVYKRQLDSALEQATKAVITN
ncbi:MAG: PDZ domain-containing protein [Candidatus Obscuribacter phosphatis]|uniref:PDZ domain-containing protein n=1 Tax=Candidatus Obscuribacter phosphatis TaxID=1906157 RepID=A0A8J7P991_9BACT|nr:PDZ domain-containing protein [Candidatus Obscuribacter phosphatis]